HNLQKHIKYYFRRLLFNAFKLINTYLPCSIFCKKHNIGLNCPKYPNRPQKTMSAKTPPRRFHHSLSLPRGSRFLWLCFIGFSLQGQTRAIGLPNIRNYTKTEYHSGTQNWDMDQDANGNMYFANNNGLLQFDGSSWHTYEIPNSKNIRSVKVDPASG